MYNNHRISHVLGMANTHTDDFNCWGATMFIAHGQDSLRWVENREMKTWITTNFDSIPRSSVKEGDIVALFDDNMRLIHTAYAVTPKQYVHKLGRNVARLESLNKVLKAYGRDTKKFVFLRSNICE